MLWIQLVEREGEVAELNKRLAGLSSELASEREHLDELEKQEGKDGGWGEVA